MANEWTGNNGGYGWSWINNAHGLTNGMVTNGLKCSQDCLISNYI